jgi:hypothetical protein
MREAVAPLVEALIVLDRAMYLYEQLPASSGGKSGRDGGGGGTGIVRLFPLFEPVLSPRNLCLYARP